jgi:hypothetical protein
MARKKPQKIILCSTAMGGLAKIIWYFWWPEKKPLKLPHYFCQPTMTAEHKINFGDLIFLLAAENVWNMSVPAPLLTLSLHTLSRRDSDLGQSRCPPLLRGPPPPSSMCFCHPPPPFSTRCRHPRPRTLLQAPPSPSAAHPAWPSPTAARVRLRRPLKAAARCPRMAQAPSGRGRRSSRCPLWPPLLWLPLTAAPPAAAPSLLMATSWMEQMWCVSYLFLIFSS